MVALLGSVGGRGSIHQHYAPVRLASQPALQAPRDALDDTVRVFANFVLPHTKVPPASCLQRERLPAVAIDVLAELAVPEGPVRSRVNVVLGAAVPEAAVDEKRELVRCDDEVGLATGCLQLQPIAKTGLPKRATNDELGLGVLALDAGHVL